MALQSLEMLWKDLRYSARVLRKNPLFTVTVVVTLALGIGANTVMFSVINAVVIEPLPYKDPDRLVRLWESNPGRPQFPVSAPNFRDWQRQQSFFQELSGMELVTFNLTGSGEPQRLAAASVSANLFSALGVEPMLGRSFLPQEENTGQNKVAILSYSLWQQQFASDKSVLNSTIQLNGESYTVIGIMPTSVQFPWARDIWVPLVLDPVREPWRADRTNRNLTAYARLKPGVTLDQASAGMSLIARNLAQQYPQSNKGWGVRLRTFSEWLMPRTVRQSVLVLFGAVGLVLLIACVNVATMLLARASAKLQQIAVCQALGASRKRVMQQVLMESSLLAALGGILGLLLAYLGTTSISAGPQIVARLSETRIDLRVLIFTLGLSIATGLLFGLVPAWWMTRSTFLDKLQEGSKQAGSGRSKHRLGGVLVTTEITLALVLLITAGLMVRSFMRLQRIPLGYAFNNVISLQISLPTTKYGTRDERVDFFNRVLEQMRNTVGVVDAAAITQPPSSSGTWAMELTFEEAENKMHGASSADARAATTHYFHTMGIPLLQGRDFVEQDSGGNQPLNLIVSEAFVRRYWPNLNPIGKRFRPGPNNPFGTVVGVVGDVRNNNLNEDIQPVFYFPYSYIGMQGLVVVVHTSTEPLALLPTLRAQVHSIDPNQPVYNVLSMRQIVSGVVAQPRFQTVLLGLFAGIALLLAIVGIYSIMAYLVRQRTREIGIRLALGAQHPDILTMIIKYGMLYVSLGIVLGIIGCLALVRSLRSVLFGMSWIDPFTMAGVALLLAAVAFLACYLPARYATRIEPSRALRTE